MDPATEDFSFIVPDWQYYASIHAQVTSEGCEVDVFAVIYEDIELKCWQKTYFHDPDGSDVVTASTSHMRWDAGTSILEVLSNFVLLMKEKRIPVHRIEFIFNEEGRGVDLYNMIIDQGFLQFEIF